MKSGWISVDDRLPEVKKGPGDIGYSSEYILLSYDNFGLPDIGEYRVDEDGGGAFYPADDERSCSSYGLFVNAWMKLPKPYRDEDV